jgi:hypothetical protein
MMGVMILAGSLALATETSTVGQGTPDLPPEARRRLDSALGLTSLPYAPFNTGETPAERARKLDAAGRAFAEVLAALAARLDEPLAARLLAAEGRNTETKLAAVALDRKARPAIYAEIERNYVETMLPFPRPRATTTPLLQDRHASDAYRLAWEFVLLRPSAGGTTQVSERALEALAKIRNDASIPTLVHLYRMTCRQGIPLRQVDTFQTRLLKAMSAFRSERGLRAMLECASLSNRQKEMPGAGETAWDAERFVRDTLAGRFGEKDRWQKLAAALPKEGLTVEESRLLESALRNP